MIKAVLFDLDGTLVNSLDDLANACNYALRCNNFPVHETEAYKYFVGNGIPKLIERILPENSRDAEIKARVSEKFYEHYSIHYADNTDAYKGLPELVNAIKKQGIKVAVVTNKADGPAKEVINRVMPNTFDLVYGQREGIPTKPDPTLTLMAMKELGVKPDECIFIGDSGMDVATGVNSGAVPVGVLWGFRKADELEQNGARYLIDVPEKLLDIIKEN